MQSSTAQGYPLVNCDACQALDQADGIVDGRLHPVLVPRVRSERAALAMMRRGQERAADAITGFAGSMSFVYLHSVWFGIWIAANVGILGAAFVFDPFPFGLLTMVVSLEAIFLSTFVLISQNRQEQRHEIRAHIDFVNNLRSELWAVHIGRAVGVDAEHVEAMVSATLEDLKQEGLR